MWKKGGIFRKAIIILFLLLIGLSAGGGLNKAFADQDIQSRLTDWFDKRKSESISEMDVAITAEKKRLMNQLRVELQLETQRAQVQLAQHTAGETAQSIKELQKYAAELAAGIHVSNDAEKAAVSTNMDAALAEAMALLKGSAVVPKLPDTPKPELTPDKGEATTETGNSPVQKPDPKPTPVPVPEEKPVEQPSEPDSVVETNETTETQ